MDKPFPVTRKQRDYIANLFNDLGVTTSQGRITYLLEITGEQFIDDLSSTEAGVVIDELKSRLGRD